MSCTPCFIFSAYHCLFLVPACTAFTLSVATCYLIVSPHLCCNNTLTNLDLCILRSPSLIYPSSSSRGAEILFVKKKKLWMMLASRTGALFLSPWTWRFLLSPTSVMHAALLEWEWDINGRLHLLVPQVIVNIWLCLFNDVLQHMVNHNMKNWIRICFSKKSNCTVNTDCFWPWRMDKGISCTKDSFSFSNSIK